MIRFTKIPYAVRLLLTDRCNLNCIFCLRDSENQGSGEELNTEQWLRFFVRLKELRVFRISLSGGEIFLRDDIFVLLKRLKENRMHRVSILSNGTLISKKVADQLSELNLKSISISVDGLEQKHDRIRGEGAFRETMNGIQCLLGAGIKPNISFTPTRENYEDAGPLIDLMASLGISTIQVNNLSPEGRCLNIYEALLLEYPHQVKAFLDVIEKKQKEFPAVKISCQFGYYYYLPRLYEDFKKNPQEYEIQNLKSGCGAAATSCAVTPTGDVVPCEGFLTFKGGNIKEKDLYEIWNESENFKTIRELSKISMDQTPHCKDCKYIYLCDAGCRAAAYMVYNDLLAPGLLCPFKKGGQRNG